MQHEGQYFDKKSLKTLTCGSVNWSEIVRDCVAFATARGGKIVYGIENHSNEPPVDQVIDRTLPDILLRKVTEKSINLLVVPRIVRHANGGEVLEVEIPRALGVPSTSDGRFAIRIADESKPVLGDEILRLATDRVSFSWETQCALLVPVSNIDTAKWTKISRALRDSSRVKDSIKEKSDEELLVHYIFARDGFLTNLGVLCVGRAQDRARLGVAPVVQYIKYDEYSEKINKISWDDYSFSPLELVDAIWNEIPDFKEFYEFPEGLFRQQIPIYDKTVIRELVVNALVHRSYTQRGDIFINSFADKLTIVNPGPLPVGVTPQNILHASVRRNENLARIFHDLKFMEREGSGFDKIYEIMLSQGKSLPYTCEGADRVEVSIQRNIVDRSVIDFLEQVDRRYRLTQREKITLGILAQHEVLHSIALAKLLSLDSTDQLKNWISRLVEFGIVNKKGKTQATSFFVDPNLIRNVDFIPSTTLSRIEPHRLKALIVEDLYRYPKSSSGDIHRRIGIEVPIRRVRQVIDQLCKSGEINHAGERRWRRYWLA